MGKRNALQGQPETPPHLQEDDTERLWDPATPVDDVVQERVAGVVIGLGIPPEVMPLVQGSGQLLENDERGGLLTEPPPDLFGKPVQARQVHLHRELGVLLLGHQEGHSSKVQIPLGTTYLAGEPLPGRRSRCRHDELSRCEVGLRSLPYPGTVFRWPGPQTSSPLPPPMTDRPRDQRPRIRLSQLSHGAG